MAGNQRHSNNKNLIPCEVTCSREGYHGRTCVQIHVPCGTDKNDCSLKGNQTVSKRSLTNLESTKPQGNSNSLQYQRCWPAPSFMMLLCTLLACRGACSGCPHQLQTSLEVTLSLCLGHNMLPEIQASHQGFFALCTVEPPWTACPSSQNHPCQGSPGLVNSRTPQTVLTWPPARKATRHTQTTQGTSYTPSRPLL